MLRRIEQTEADAALPESSRAQLDQKIRELQQTYFAPGAGINAQLHTITERWVKQVS